MGKKKDSLRELNGHGMTRVEDSLYGTGPEGKAAWEMDRELIAALKRNNRRTLKP